MQKWLALQKAGGLSLFYRMVKWILELHNKRGLESLLFPLLSLQD